MMKQAVGAVSIFVALTSAASAQTPVGGEFRVNTYTYGGQNFARPAMEPDGDFVVVWEHLSDAISDYEVRGQRFAASGTPRGGEFSINTYTNGIQKFPHIAVGSEGDFVVVWENLWYSYGYRSIQARRFDASGNAIGDEFQVDSTTMSGNQYQPHVGLAADGGFVVSWMSKTIDGSGAGIAARRFDASGNAIGLQFVVNSYTTGYQDSADLAVEANGNFVVVWTDRNYRDGSESGIFGQRHDASGNRLGSEFQVNTYTTGGQGNPSVSVSPAGGFVVVWSGPDGFASGVFARRFDASGNAMGNDFVVNTYTTGSQYGTFGQVAHDAGGNFVVTWHGPGVGDAIDVSAQRFSAWGARRGAEFRVNTFTTGNQLRPSVTSDSVGNFLVVWDSFGQDGSGAGVFAQRYGIDDLIFQDGFDSGAMSP